MLKIPWLFVTAVLSISVGAALLSHFATPTPRSDETPVVDADGIWTIKSLGYSDVVVQTDGAIQRSDPIRYRLPPRATQGEKTWYLLFLHSLIEIDAGTGSGRIYVSGATNERTATQIRLETLGPNRGVVYSIVDMVNGSQTGLISSRSRANGIELSTVNFLQIGGVSSEDNDLSFQLEQYGGAKVKRFVVLDDSGIIRTALGPSELELDIQLPNGEVRVQDEFSVTVRLNNGGWPAKDVTLRATYPEDGIRSVGADSYYFSSLHMQSVRRFTFQVLKEGPHTIEINAAGSSGTQARQMVQVDTGPKRSQRGYYGLPWYSWVGVGVLAVVVLALVTMAYRRRQQQNLTRSKSSRREFVRPK